MRTVLICLRVTLAELAQLSNPVADVALVGVIVKLLPFVHVNTSTLVDVLAAVGLLASWGKTQLQNVPARVTAEKSKAKPPAPAPAPVQVVPPPAA